MQIRKIYEIIPVLVSILILVSVLLFWSVLDANAQCGSQASSCKNCHEVQGQFPVNGDGTGWHEGHAFGDFCYICHAGNNQSMAAEEAHAGMVAPLSDVEASCQSCHPADLMEKAQVYATALGVEIGTGGGTTSASNTTTTSNQVSSSESPIATPPALDMVVETSSDIIDYNQLYAEEVLGQRAINVGNLILIFSILAIAVGGGSFIYYNERKLQGKPFLPAKQTTEVSKKELPIPQIEGYPKEVLALLPKVARLNPIGLQALQRLLENPDQANEMLHSLSRLDPDLLLRIRSLDHESRALLMALAGK